MKILSEIINVHVNVTYGCAILKVNMKNIE
jgi:hypothetical protein